MSVRSWRHLILAFWCLLPLTQLALSEDKPSASASATVDKLWTISTTVLEKHIEPPTRQEMLLAAARGLFKAAKLTPPHELSRKFSQQSAEDELRALVADAWQAAAKDSADTAMLEAQAIESLLQAVPGGGDFLPSKEFAVQQQLNENRYVGIGIELAMDQKDGLPFIRTAIRRGPLHRAGGRDEDRIIAVDGQSTESLKLAEVVELLRGPEGSAVQVELRAPGASDSRTLEIVRGVVPLETVQGYRRVDDEWDYRVETESPIGYLQFTSIGPSTLLELRTAAARMRAQGARALILDLREMGRGNVHHASIVADALLATGKIGRVQRIDGTGEYESRPDHLFSGWSMAVLVDRGTGGEAEWVAAALQDNHRAMVVGEPTSGQAYVTEMIPLPRGLGGVRLRVAVLERGDGRALLSLRAQGRGGFSMLSVMRAESARPGGHLLAMPGEVGPGRADGGVVPDHHVKLERERRQARPRSPDEDRAHPDPFIARAVELLGKQVAVSE
jgi:carboxyl-terminal processing protease